MKRKIVAIRLEPKIVAVTWKQCNDSEVWETCSLKSVEHPTPPLKKAIQALLPTALRLLELPASYAGGCSVRQVVFDEIGDEQSFSVQVVKRLGEGDGERMVQIRTPFAMAVAGSAVRCTEKDIDLVTELQQQAEAYLDGERDADDLFGAKQGKPGSGGDIGQEGKDDAPRGDDGEGDGDGDNGNTGKAVMPKGKKAKTSAKKPAKKGK